MSRPEFEPLSERSQRSVFLSLVLSVVIGLGGAYLLVTEGFALVYGLFFLVGLSSLVYAYHLLRR